MEQLHVSNFHLEVSKELCNSCVECGRMGAHLKRWWCNCQRSYDYNMHL